MSLLSTRYVLAGKVESTYNVDAVPTGSDACLAENLAPTRPAEMIDRNQLGDPSLSPFRPVYGRAIGQIAFDVELKGSSNPSTPPEWSPFMQCCGFEVTTEIAVHTKWNLRSSGTESITIYAWRDGIRYSMTGCRGNVVLRFPAGQRPMASFTIQGHLPPGISMAVDEAMPTPTLDVTVPYPVKGISLNVGGYAARVGSLEVDLQNAIVVPDDVNSADGYGEVQITARDGQGSFNPEATTVAESDWFNEWYNSTRAQASFLTGFGSGEQLFYELGMVYRAVDDADDNGILRYQIPFSLPRDVGDDEFAITQT